MNERCQFIAPNNCSGGIIWIAHIDDARLRRACGGHLWKVMAMIAVQSEW